MVYQAHEVWRMEDEPKTVLAASGGAGFFVTQQIEMVRIYGEL